MIQGVMPTVYVSDLARAVKFYGDVLGLQIVVNVPKHWATLTAPDGTRIGLHPPSPKSLKPGLNGGVQLGFGVAGPMEQVVADLTARGVTFQGPIKEDPPVRLAFFEDPDGNGLYLCETKPWPGSGQKTG